MKIKGWQVIVFAIVLFILDLFTLGNRQIIDNQIINQIAFFIAVLCLLFFLLGIIKALHDFFSKNKDVDRTVVSPDVSQDKNQRLLTPLEVAINRFFAVLLFLTTLPLLLNIFTIPTIIIFVIFAIFLFFSKKYHFITNIIFLIFAAGVYFIPLPIGWGVYHSLKMIRLTGFNFITVSAFFNVCTIIFVAFAVRNILGNIQAFFKNSLASRNSYYLISLVTIFITLVAFPLFDHIGLRTRAFEDDNGAGKLILALVKQELKCGRDSCSSSASSRDYTARFDPDSKKYVYRLNFRDPIAETILFTEVATDGNKINFSSDSRVVCINCQINAPYGLVFPGGSTIDFIISSNQMIKDIKFIEQDGVVDDFFFWK